MTAIDCVHIDIMLESHEILNRQRSDPKCTKGIFKLISRNKNVIYHG